MSFVSLVLIGPLRMMYSSSPDRPRTHDIYSNENSKTRTLALIYTRKIVYSKYLYAESYYDRKKERETYRSIDEDEDEGEDEDENEDGGEKQEKQATPNRHSPAPIIYIYIYVAYDMYDCQLQKVFFNFFNILIKP